MLTVMSWNLQCLSHHSSMFCSRDMQILMLSNRVITLMMVHTQVQNNRRHEANIFYGSPMYSVWINKSNKEWDLEDRMSALIFSLLLFAFLHSICTIQILQCSLTNTTLAVGQLVVQSPPLFMFFFFNDGGLKSWDLEIISSWSITSSKCITFSPFHIFWVCKTTSWTLPYHVNKACLNGATTVVNFIT